MGWDSTEYDDAPSSSTRDQRGRPGCAGSVGPTGGLPRLRRRTEWNPSQLTTLLTHDGLLRFLPARRGACFVSPETRGASDVAPAFGRSDTRKQVIGRCGHGESSVYTPAPGHWTAPCGPSSLATCTCTPLEAPVPCASRSPKPGAGPTRRGSRFDRCVQVKLRFISQPRHRPRGHERCEEAGRQNGHPCQGLACDTGCTSPSGSLKGPSFHRPTIAPSRGRAETLWALRSAC